MLRNRVMREGLVAGILGASSVALWFLAVDVVAGEPLRTPRLLGAAAYSVLGGHAGGAIVWPVVGYTLIHYATFIAIGTLASWLTTAADRAPALWAGLFLLFAVFELGFYGACTVMSMLNVVGELAWNHIAVANAIAAGAMGTYMWRRHPEVARHLSAALRGVV